MLHFKNLLKLVLVVSACMSLIALNMGIANAADGLKLSWKNPTKFIDGSRLNPRKDLKGYHLYYGGSEETIKDHVVFLEPTAHSIKLSLLELSKLKTALVYFAMTSVLKNGSESELSPSIFYLP